MGITQNTGASSLIKPGVIDNTAARPASPYEGQVIFQKDTDEILAYNGTSWTRPANTPWGIVGYARRTSGNVSLSPTIADIPSMSVTFTAVANRLYRASWTATGQKITSGGYTGIYCFVGAGNTCSVYDTVGANEYWNCSGVSILFGYSGSTTVTLRGDAGFGGSNVFAGGDPCILIVEDIGPA